MEIVHKKYFYHERKNLRKSPSKGSKKNFFFKIVIFLSFQKKWRKKFFHSKTKK